MLFTDKQTNNRQTNATKNITSFAKEVITHIPDHTDAREHCGHCIPLNLF